MDVLGRSQFDVLLIGSGLGATACAYALVQGGKHVGIIAGVGRPRSLEADGGVIDPQLVASAFGEAAPLGHTVSWRQTFSAEDVNAGLQWGVVEEMRPRQTYRRLELESWARQRAIAAGAEYLDGFVEGKVLQAPDETLTLTSEAGDRALTAGTIALCEGSDPRIAMRAGLRPDYDPEEQLHFARTMIAQSPTDVVYRMGSTRTSWGMPITIAIVPLQSSVIVSVAARMENIMRSSRSSVDALNDLLTSRLAEDLRLQGERIHTGVELVAMRQDPRNVRLSHDGLLTSLDASGILDPREARRADVTIKSGMHLGAYLAKPGHGSWDGFAGPVLEHVRAVNSRWKDGQPSGFIEEPNTGARDNPFSHVGVALLRRLRIRG